MAPAAGSRIAHLTLDVDLQRATQRLLRKYEIPEAAVVVMDVASGRLLVWANHTEKEKGESRDLCVDASAPAASIFKIVTAAALVEQGGLTPDARQCYSGGENRLTLSDLVDDPKKDRWCATLGEAMGRSINAVFARLALKSLTPATLTAMAA